MYATRDDMVKRYSLTEVSQLERYLTGSESVDAAIADAGSIIDGWIGAKYAVPLEYPPDNIKIFVCDIARYLLWKSKASEEVRRRYDDAMSYLKGVSKGTNVLLVKNPTTQEVKPAAKSPTAMPMGTTYRGGVFSDDVLNKMPSVK
jgi:phage gp36-like protein